MSDYFERKSAEKVMQKSHAQRNSISSCSSSNAQTLKEHYAKFVVCICVCVCMVIEWVFFFTFELRKSDNNVEHGADWTVIERGWWNLEYVSRFKRDVLW